jgi:hypothetical protein
MRTAVTPNIADLTCRNDVRALVLTTITSGDEVLGGAFEG